MIDAHCHLQASPNFSQGSRILADFDEALRPKMLKLAAEYPNTFCVIGTHPWKASKENPADWIHLMSADFIDQHSIVGIGEIGLDYFRGASDDEEKAVQNSLFETQIGIAAKFQLPIVLHCVKAHQDLLHALSNFEYGGIIHGFRSSHDLAKQYLKEGFLISIGNAIHAQNSVKLRDAVRRIGVDNIVAESDAQCLEEAALDKTMETLAEIFKLDIESIEKKLVSNLKRAFPKVKR